MHLVPVPTTPQYLDATFPLWSPFLPRIAERSKETVAELLAQVARIEVQPVLVMDGKQPAALLGVRYVEQGGKLIAELVWMTGKDMRRWMHLLADLERYLTEHVGVAEIRPICRPGWSRLLKQHGYHITHYVMEKVPHGRKQ